MSYLKVFITSVLFILLGCGSSDSWGATIAADTCSYADVTTAISSANAEDTVTVPAGNCTWATNLIITEGINLIGDGIGSTNITNSYSCSSSEFFIQYNPSDYSANNAFRLSGFAFDLGSLCKGVRLGQNNKTAPFTIQTKVRVDNNRFDNASAQYIWNQTMYGVADHNEFAPIFYPIRANPDTDNSWWQNFTITPGTADDNFYYEDNTFEGVGTFGSDGIVSDCQFSGRYVYRYNDIVIVAQGQPLFDMHGNWEPTFGNLACFGGEIYGNDIVGDYFIRLLDHRGGQAMVFYNNQTSSGSTLQIRVREEYDDSLNPPATAPDGQTQHVSDSYYWNNRMNVTGTVNTIDEQQHVGDIPLEDRDFFRFNESFDGTSGVGCGTLGSRPATCTTGVGYWATNQSCSNLSNLVGVDPSTPISGTLYKCTATDTWTSFFTPYTYPHPLISGVSVPDETTEWANHNGYEWVGDVNEFTPTGGSVNTPIPAISTDQGSIEELGW